MNTKKLAQTIADSLSQTQFVAFAALMRGYEVDCGDSNFELTIRKALVEKYPEVSKIFDQCENEGKGYPV